MDTKPDVSQLLENAEYCLRQYREIHLREGGSYLVDALQLLLQAVRELADKAE